MEENADQLKLHYGSTGRTSVATGHTRNEWASTGARGSRRSLADEFDRVKDSTAQNENYVKDIKILSNPASIGHNVEEITNLDRRESNDIELGVRTMQSSSRHVDGVTNRHVLFTRDFMRQNNNSHNELVTEDSPPRHVERETERLHHYHNQNNIDDEDQGLDDSMSRIRSMTDTSTPNTHSEAEECNESDFSIALSTDTVTLRRRSRAGSTFSSLITPRRRRRRISRPGARVTDSYADECFCCCSIL